MLLVIYGKNGRRISSGRGGGRATVLCFGSFSKKNNFKIKAFFAEKAISGQTNFRALRAREDGVCDARGKKAEIHAQDFSRVRRPVFSLN